MSKVNVGDKVGFSLEGIVVGRASGISPGEVVFDIGSLEGAGGVRVSERGLVLTAIQESCLKVVKPYYCPGELYVDRMNRPWLRVRPYDSGPDSGKPWIGINSGFRHYEDDPSFPLTRMRLAEADDS